MRFRIVIALNSLKKFSKINSLKKKIFFVEFKIKIIINSMRILFDIILFNLNFFMCVICNFAKIFNTSFRFVDEILYNFSSCEIIAETL